MVDNGYLNSSAEMSILAALWGFVREPLQGKSEETHNVLKVTAP